MSLVRPVVSVYECAETLKKGDTIKVPDVFRSYLRPDIVRSVFSDVAKNKRQAYAVSAMAGHQTAAESWGTGRAVSRIPRVPGGGTGRSAQGAFGNMCRGGHMFAPTKTWRRWHRSPNVTQKRHAVASSIAASAVPALVMARGHNIEKVTEWPVVVSESFETLKKTKEVIKALEQLGFSSDLSRVSETRKIRVGKGKLRNRRHSVRKSVLVVYENDNGIRKACRNIPGVESCTVEQLSVLQTAPGGNFGRAIVWTKPAFEKLASLWGKMNSAGTAPLKSGYHLPRSLMTNSDLSSIISSSAIASAVRPAKEARKYPTKHFNAITNKRARRAVDPSYKSRLSTLIKSRKAGTPEHETAQKAISKRKAAKKAYRKSAAKKQTKAHVMIA